MFYLLSKWIRTFISNPGQMCDECLDISIHQTKDSKQLCERCYKQYLVGLRRV